MRKITYGLLWFQLILMNIGLVMGTVGFILIIQTWSPLIQYGFFPLILGVLYVFFYSLLVIGVVGYDLHVKQKGIKSLYELGKDAEL